MSHLFTPARSVLGGTALLMACACGAAAGSSKLLAAAGMSVSTKIVHPVFLAGAVALILHGLWRTARPSAHLAMVAFAVMAMGAVLTPPSVMTMNAHAEHGHGGLPWNAMQMMGAALYVVAGAILAYAFWRAFPSPKPSASATAVGGMTLATGCNCCLVTGAVAGMIVTAGGSPAYFNAFPLVFWTGLAAVAVGLWRLGGWRAAAWVPVGGLVIRGGFALTSPWTWNGVNAVFLLKYFIYAAGAGLILNAFAIAYRAAARPGTEPTPTRIREFALEPLPAD